MSNFNLQSLSKSFTVARAKTFDIFSNVSLDELKFRLRKINKNILLIVVLIVLGLLILGIGRALTGGGRITAPAPVATQTLNKKFDFPLRDQDGKVVALIAYELQNANLQESFIYQGKMATAVKGRTFLIFNLKITNPYSKPIEINSRDYIRVSVNDSKELLAPEIHNDPVEIQAKSTKYTRIGLPINETDKKLVLFIGELNGKKETINLTLSK